MPATIRHWISARPGDVGGDRDRRGDQAADVGREALRAGVAGRGSRSPRGSPRSTSPCCSASCLSAASAAGGSGPTPWIARCSASRTNVAVRSGARSRERAARRLPARALPLTLMRRAVRSPVRLRSSPCPSSRRRLRWSFPAIRRGCDDSDDLVGGRGRPGAGHAAGGVPARDVPDAVRHARRPDVLVSARSAAACCRSCGRAVSPVAAPLGARLRDPGRHRVRGGGRRVRGPAPRQRLDRRRHPGGVPAAARARLGALGRGLARRAAGRRAVRRGDRRAVRRGVDVPPASATPRRWRWSGCAGCSTTQLRGPRLLDVQWGTPHLAWLGVVEISRREYLPRLADAVRLPRPTSRGDS